MTMEDVDIDIGNAGSEAWKSILDDVLGRDLSEGYDPDVGSQEDTTQVLLYSAKRLLDESLSGNTSSAIASVNSDIAQTSKDLADAARVGDDGFFSQMMKGIKSSYGGMDAEGKKFMFSTLTGLLNYDNMKKTREAQTKLAEAAMMNAQTNASTLQNKIDLQGSVGKMKFQTRSGKGLIYQNPQGQAGA